MGKIIDNEKLLECVHGLNEFMSKQNLNHIELQFVIKEYMKSIEVFDKLNVSKALRQTLEEMEGK